MQKPNNAWKTYIYVFHSLGVNKPYFTRLLSKHFCLQPFSPKRFSFFTVSLVIYLREVLPLWAPNRKFLKFRYPDCCKMHFWHSFWHPSAAAIFLQTLEFLGKFYEIEFHNSIKNLSFYYCLLVVEKCLEKCLHTTERSKLGPLEVIKMQNFKTFWDCATNHLRGHPAPPPQTSQLISWLGTLICLIFFHDTFKKITWWKH